MIIGIDFDGTCVTHEYPRVGKDIGAALVLKELVKVGHKLILFTMRSGIGDNQSTELKDAVQWFKDNDIELYGINQNPDQHWSNSPKAYCHLYIDDASLGCPLVYPGEGRPYADWSKIREILISQQRIKGYIHNPDCDNYVPVGDFIKLS